MSTFFVDCYTTNVEQSKKIDKFLFLLDESGVCDFLEKEIKKNETQEDKGGRPTYNPYNLLAVSLYIISHLTKVRLGILKIKLRTI